MKSDVNYGEVRERKKGFLNNVREKDVTSSSMRKTQFYYRSISLRRCMGTFLLLAIFLFCSSLLLGRLPWSQHGHATGVLDTLALKVGLQERVYSIIFDAGSTGSRILVFTFHRIKADGSLKLDKEFFKEIKPGLSYYAANPVQAAKSLQPLLEEAKLEIPMSYWNHTPLVLKATAGLRLLPGDQAESILKEVKILFKRTPFLTNDNSVSIMEGKDEGLFSWFTVNFLLDKLAGDETVACLDLGGGSTQITFVHHEGSLIVPPKDHLHTMTLFSRTVNLYSHSYLGLGLMSARLSILQAGNNITLPSGEIEYQTPCLHSSIRTTWEYANKKHFIIGSKMPNLPNIPNAIPSEKNIVPRFEACFKLANSLVNEKVYHPDELLKQQVYAISYYYDRATESGLIDPFDGGSIIIGRYFQAAKEACSRPNSEQPFTCMDLSYISSLLSQGFGLKVSNTVVLQKKLKNHEISWALGAAFHVLSNEHINS